MTEVLSVHNPIELSSLRRSNHDGPKVDDADDSDKVRDVVIHMDNVHKTYLLGIEGVPALRGVTLSIRRGDFVIIFGTSGGGKTTMLNIIGTIDKPSKGQLFLFGNRITSHTEDSELAAIRSRKMGFVFQTFNLLSSMSAIENVEMPMILAGGKDGEERHKRCVELLENVGMGHRLDHYPSQLSGGEQQRVTIARAIANNPELLLLDEPTGDLDTRNGHIVMKMLLDLNEKQGMTLVMVTHDVNLKNFAHKIVRMRDGKIAQIENVSLEQRASAKRQLLIDLGELSDSPVTVEKSSEAPSIAPVETLFSKTEIRQPMNYSYLAWGKQPVNTTTTAASKGDIRLQKPSSSLKPVVDLLDSPQISGDSPLIATGKPASNPLTSFPPTIKSLYPDIVPERSIVNSQTALFGDAAVQLVVSPRGSGTATVRRLSVAHVEEE